MGLERIPLVGSLLAAGADDPVFDTLLILGPVVVGTITVLGRTGVSIALALAYTGGFAAYVAYKGLAGESNT